MKVVAQPQLTRCKNVIKTDIECDEFKYAIQNFSPHRNVNRWRQRFGIVPHIVVLIALTTIILRLRPWLRYFS